MLRFLIGKRERVRREAADWVARLEGHPAPLEREAFRDWYQADPLHAQTFERVKGVYGAAGLLAQTELGRNRALPDRSKAGWRSGYAMAAGLAALLVVAGAALLGRPDALMPRAEAETLLFATSVGEIRQVPLPDGSRMTLDAKSSAQVKMGRDRRQVLLSEGRARFALASKDERPFVVEAGRTVVTGTAGTFDVARFMLEALLVVCERHRQSWIAAASSIKAAAIRLVRRCWLGLASSCSISSTAAMGGVRG